METMIVRHTGIGVPNYQMGDCEYLEKYLSVYDKAYFTHRPMAYHYDEDECTLYIPRGIDIQKVSKMLGRKVEYVSDAIDPRDCLIQLYQEPKNNIQQSSIAFLLGKAKFAYTETKSQLALNLDTGDGKTYCVIAALSFMRTPSLIMTHVTNIKEQWIDSIVKFTNITESEICNVEGSKVIERLLKIDKDNLKYKAYVCNRKTLNSYAKKCGWSAVEKFIEHIQIGVKVFDEAHIEFKTMMNIDFYSNVKKTIYLTANFERSEFRENKVFGRSFENIPKYGISTRASKAEHINYIPVSFDSQPSMNATMDLRSQRGGIDVNKYDEYLSSKDVFQYLIDEIISMIDLSKGRLLIMTSRIKTTEIVTDYLQNKYPEKTVGTYNSKIPEKEKEKIKDSYDIISSTPKSMGTGTDIPGLRYVINFSIYSSQVTANQLSGRLRALESGEDTFFFEPVDEGFKDIKRMYKKRLPVFKKKCKKIIEIKC